MAARDMVLLSGGSRLAGDEPNAEYVPSDVVITSASQGGFKTLDCSLMRSASTKALERMYGTVTLLDDTGELYWNGELRRPDSSTIVREQQTQTPQALGWQAVAEDREDVVFIGIDRELGRWDGPSLDRQTAWINVSYRPTTASAEQGGLKFIGTGAWATDAGRPAVIARYRGNPVRVGRVGWSAAISNGVGNDWVGRVERLDADGAYVSNALADWVTAAASGSPATAVHPSQNISINSPGVEVSLTYPTSPITDGDTSREVTIRDLFVLQDHGLTLVGTDASDYGLLASDMVRWLIASFGEGVLRAGYIPATTAPIGHFTQTEHGTLGQAINGINAFHGYTSAIWENGEWDFHEFGQSPRSKTWVVDINDAELVETKSMGLDGSMLWSGLVVTFTDPTGERRSVGPPGSVADEHDERLELTDPTHPCVAEGKRRWCRLDIGSPVTKETAVLAGAVCLAERNQSRRAGSVTLVGDVLDRDADVKRPASRMRGGDQLIIAGRGDDMPHRIVEATGTPALDSGDLTLDDTRAQSDLLLAHLQAQLTGRL